ncbi:MAG: fumarylacetoacetate hydrolase family protein [Candidatus Omnitrophica bacterium]|nr:fumarylacetoacetate hydrolase family protein [Candidatus Omnitrophota bacterium]
MRYVKFESNDIIRYGIIKDGAIYPDENKARSPYEPIELKDAKILCPVSPTKIVAVGLNYTDHAKELNMPIPKEPLIFLKPPSSAIGPEDAIICPVESKRVDYEAELAVVIKKRARNISTDEADDYILGYTCLNDITARDLQKKDTQWTRAKSFDTFCPIGPFIESDIDASSLKIELLLNGRVRQSSNTSNMVFGCKKLIAYISHIMTLEKYDVIATGTPAGVGELKHGDRVEVRIEKVGSLVNNVVKDI